ncbi:MAG: hypothetical protein SWZ49_01565 [Cyanobacteriota bacterium]|nr:hypothetical protein [Cyanobacteriota bacterium]
MITTNQSRTEVQEIVSIFYSPKIEEALMNEPDKAKKKAFIEKRREFDNRLHKLETQSLETVLAKIKSSKAELDQAIESLNKAINSVENTLTTISTIEKITRILTRIIPLF